LDKAKSRCPQGSGNPSLLFMHIEKTGGTVLRQMLKAVLDYNDYEMYDGQQVGHLTPKSKTKQFVIGLVRRPCDYILSRYCMGLFVDTQSRDEMEKLEDKGEFRDLVMKLTNGTLDETTNEKWVMSRQIEERYGNKNNADCWMRTHSLKSDFIECLRQYQACGGSLIVDTNDVPQVVDAAMHETSKEMAKDNSRSVGSHPACTDMFDHEMIANVVKTQQKVIDDFNLGTCCSSDPKSLVRDDEVAELRPFFDLDWQID